MFFVSRSLLFAYLVHYESREGSLKMATLSDGRSLAYMHNTTGMTFSEADNWCYDIGGSLPEPLDAVENEFLQSLGNTWLNIFTDSFQRRFPRSHSYFDYEIPDYLLYETVSYSNWDESKRG